MKKFTMVILILAILLSGCGPTTSITEASPTEPTIPPTKPVESPTNPPAQLTVPSEPSALPATVPTSTSPATSETGTIPSQRLEDMEAYKSRTVITDYAVEYCILEDIDTFSGTNYPCPYPLMSYQKFQNYLERVGRFFSKTATSDVYQKSFQNLIDKYDESYFEDNVLLIIHDDARDGRLPNIAKVDIGEAKFFGVENGLVVYTDYRTDVQIDSGWMVSIFVEIPRKYEKYASNGWSMKIGMHPYIW